jgi:hypothetical protein
MIARLIRKFRAWRIRAMEQDLDWALEQFDVYLADHCEKLRELRAKQYGNATSEQVTRNVLQRARGY